MSSISSDYERFLFANFPDDYQKATGDNVKDDVLTYLLSKHAAHYRVWCDVPEWVKNHYHDKLPQEVFNGNKTSKDFVLEEEAKLKDREEKTDMLIDYGVSLLALGYNATATTQLLKNRHTREDLLKAANGGELTEEQKEQWRLSRQNDRETIANDWKDNSPEKYLMHLLREVSRGDKKASRDAALKEGWDVERSAKMAEVSEFLSALDTKEAKQKLIDYMRQPSEQAALRHLSPELFGDFSRELFNAGISIEPSNANETKGQLTNEELVFGFKKNFQYLEQMRKNFMDSHKLESSLVGKITPEFVAYSNDISKGLDNMVALRKGARSTSSSGM